MVDIMIKSKKDMIGYCGYNCQNCAARSSDIKVREKLVNAWRKYLGIQNYTAENVYCEGCKSKGDIIAYKECKARPCARAKGLDSCAQCNEFPCDNIKLLLDSIASLTCLKAPKIKDMTEEEFNYCMQQWNSMPNLVKALVDEGKIPKFILKRI